MQSTLVTRQDLGARALFHEALASLCRSELPLDEALRIASADIEDTALRQATLRIADDIHAGTSFDEAYARHCSDRAEHIAIVKAGIECNDLPGALCDVARDERLRSTLHEELEHCLARPLMSALVVASVGVVVLFMTAPWSAMQAKFTELSPGLVRQDKGLSLSAWNAITTTVLTLLVVVTATVGWQLHRCRRGRSNLRFLRPLTEGAERARFAASLATLLRRFLPLDRALAVLSDGIGDARLREDALSAQRAAAAGCGVAAALADTRLLSKDLAYYVASSEKLGDAATALEQVAAVEEQRFLRRARLTARALGPAIEVAIGFVVFVFALSYLYPAMRIFGDLFSL